jgi:hypothetical protein
MQMQMQMRMRSFKCGLRGARAALPTPFKKKIRPARHALDDLYDHDSVVGSDGFDGMNDEGDSDCLGY